MGLPSKRRTSRSKRERAAHFAVRPVTAGLCIECGASTMPHMACPSCGKYRGRTAVNVAKRANRAVRRAKKMK